MEHTAKDAKMTTLDAWVQRAMGEAAFAVVAHGFEAGKHGDYHYVQVQRNLRPAYMDTMSTPLFTLHPQRAIPGDISDRTLDDIGCDELLVYGALRHGEGQYTTTVGDIKRQQVNLPREQRSFFNRLFDRPQKEEKRESVEKTVIVPYTIPSLREVTTLTEEEMDIGMLSYTFRHAGEDDSHRRANPVKCYLLGKPQTCLDLTRFCRDNPGQVYPLFERLAGDFPRKRAVFNPRLNGTLGGIGIGKLPQALYDRQFGFKLTYK